ncbi:MAG: sensor histidine kinase, partial [Bacillales bacterium]
FAIKIDEGVILDLRMIPVYFAYMYGGNMAGLTVTFFYLLVRLLLGGWGMVPSFIVLIIMTALIQLFIQSYPNWKTGKKIWVSSSFVFGVSFFMLLIGLFLLDLTINPALILTGILFILESGVVTWLVVFLIELHREKLQLVQDIQKTEKLNVVGQLAASVAHEIRNPMTSVRGFIQLLSNSDNLTKDQKQYISICLEELDRANSIINDYLSLGRETNMKGRQKVNVINEIRRSINALTSYANLRNVEITFNYKDEIYINGHSGRFRQLLINLIKNGIEAISDSGKIVVTAIKTAKEAIIYVSDNGEGMNEEQIENLGLPFYSTKEKGTGLGLMVSLHIIKEMEGRLEVHSKEGTGTTFEITFPLAEEPEKPEEETKEEKQLSR